MICTMRKNTLVVLVPLQRILPVQRDGEERVCTHHLLINYTGTFMGGGSLAGGVGGRRRKDMLSSKPEDAAEKEKDAQAGHHEEQASSPPQRGISGDARMFDLWEGKRR